MVRDKSRIDLLRGTYGAFYRRPEMQTTPDAALVAWHPLEKRRQGPGTEVAKEVFMLGHLDHRLHERVECLVCRVITPLTRGCRLTRLEFPREQKRIPCGVMRRWLKGSRNVSAGRSCWERFAPLTDVLVRRAIALDHDGVQDVCNAYRKCRFW